MKDFFTAGLQFEVNGKPAVDESVYSKDRLFRTMYCSKRITKGNAVPPLLQLEFDDGKILDFS